MILQRMSHGYSAAHHDNDEINLLSPSSLVKHTGKSTRSFPFHQKDIIEESE